MRWVAVVVVGMTALAIADQPAPDGTAQARAHFRAGTELYNVGNYVDAAREYAKAYEISGRPALLFNLGQAYRLGGEPALALAAYRRYLSRVPNAAERAEVEQHIADLERQLEPSPAPALPPPVVAEPPPSVVVTAAPSRPAKRSRAWIGLVVGGAVVAVGVGVGLGVGLGMAERDPTASLGRIPGN